MSFVAQITADIANFDKNMKKAVDTTNDSTKKMQAKFDKLGDSFVNIGAKASVFSAAVVAVSVGLIKMGISAGDATARINNLAEATTLSTDVIQELSYVATASNSSFEGLSSGLDSFQRRLKSVDEEGSRVNEMLGKLGVSTKNATGTTRSMDEVLLDTFAKLGDMEKGLQRNAIGTELFGRNWNEVALIVSSGADGIEALRKEANDLGLVLDKDVLKSADDFSTAMGLVGFQVDTLKTKIGASLVPILEKSILPLLQEKIIPAVSRFADFIAQLAEKFNALSPSTKTAIFALGGIATAIGPVLLGLGGIIKILPLVIAGFTAITGPIGIAIAAIAGIAILVVKNWDAISNYFTSGGGSELFNSIKDIFITIKDVVMDVFNNIKKTITTIWNSIGDTLKRVWSNNFDTIVTVITTAFKIINGVLSTFVNLLQGDFSGALESMKTLGADVFNGLKRIVFNTVSSMATTLAKFFSFLKLNSLSDTISQWAEDIKPSTKAIGEDIATVNDKIKETSDNSGLATESLSNLGGEVEYLSPKIRTLTADNLALNKSLEGVIANMGGQRIGNFNIGGTSMDLGQSTGALTADSIWNVDNDSLSAKMQATADAVHLKTAQMNADLSDDFIDLGSMVSGALSGVFASIGDSIVSGDNVLSSLGTSLLGGLGSILIQLGEMALQVGMGLLAVQLSLKTLNPFVAIAAGGALIAIGSAFASGANKLSVSMGGGYSSAPSMRSSEVTPSMPQGEYRDSYSSSKVEFKISGDNLVGVLDRKETRRNRSL